MKDNATIKTMNKLSEPFPYKDIEWRVQQSGISRKNEPWLMVLAYVTNRAIMSRLDDVIGCFNWMNEYKEAPDGGVLCGISVHDPINGWITKWDGASNTDIESVKGGLSNAMKRAAVQWGIGRYLYNLEANFVNVHSDIYSGKYRVKIKDKQYSWDPPELPEWALPPGKKTKSKKISTPNLPKPTKKAEKQLLNKLKKKDSELPKPEYSNAELIGMIEKLGKELTPPNWKYFKESRLKKFGEKYILYLTNKQLLEFGKDLKKWIKDGEQFRESEK